MAIKVNNVSQLQAYFKGVVERSDHHAGGVNNIIYPLLGLIILYQDSNKEIEVKSYGGGSGNMIWIVINNSRYAFRYEHTDETIEIRNKTFKGDLLHKVNDATSIETLKNIFKNL